MIDVRYRSGESVEMSGHSKRAEVCAAASLIAETLATLSGAKATRGYFHSGKTEDMKNAGALDFAALALKLLAVTYPEEVRIRNG